MRENHDRPRLYSRIEASDRRATQLHGTSTHSSARPARRVEPRSLPSSSVKTIGESPSARLKREVSATNGQSSSAVTPSSNTQKRSSGRPFSSMREGHGFSPRNEPSASSVTG